jgi:hypothetical protein
VELWWFNHETNLFYDAKNRLIPQPVKFQQRYEKRHGQSIISIAVAQIRAERKMPSLLIAPYAEFTGRVISTIRGWFDSDP